MGVLLVTHDLGVMSSVADRISVFYAGRVVESGPTRDVLAAPRHPYTKQLLLALPDPESGDVPLRPIAGVPATPFARPAGCAFHPRCNWAAGELQRERPAAARGRRPPASRPARSTRSRAAPRRGSRPTASPRRADDAAATLAMRDVVVDYRRKHLADVRAVAGATLLVERGQVHGLVGESGCGKSTLARAATGLVPITSGSIEFAGEPVTTLTRRARPRHLRRLQMVFQDPNSSLNPRRSVGDQLEFALKRGADLPARQRALPRAVSCSTRSACRATRHVACRPSSAAASGSGSASPARSPPTRR